MKNLIAILLLILCSCRVDYEKADNHVHLPNYQVNITEVHYAKHSTVIGYITYKGKDYTVQSTNGYYYKKYNLKPGDQVYLNIDIYYFVDKNDEYDEFDDVTTIKIKEIDVSKFEIIE